MRRNVIETVLGAVVLLVAALFVIFAYTNASLRTVSGYQLVAKFDRVDGLNTGSDVKMSGIKVGTITGQDIDPQSFLAVVHLSVDPRIKLPSDSAAEVVSDGLLGGKYLSLVPGADSKLLEAGGEIKFTQSPINLESLIGQLLFSNQKGGEAGDKTAAPAPDGVPGGTL
jgi:phospholipid/cholesterol/gamma-HCH transport system substrate-binding protein